MKRSVVPRAVALSAVLAIVCAAVAASTTGALAQRQSLAHAAGTQSLIISGTLRITKAAGFIVEASGPVSGTLRGTLSAHFLLLSTDRLTATFTGYPHAGSLSGKGTGTYHLAGPVASFTGTASITGGSGVYAHASGGGIQVEGAMNRQKKIVTVHVSGKFKA